VCVVRVECAGVMGDGQLVGVGVAQSLASKTVRRVVGGRDWYVSMVWCSRNMEVGSDSKVVKGIVCMLGSRSRDCSWLLLRTLRDRPSRLKR
jgi:hypothetical protein